jgi:hypothetical protein
LNEHLGRLTDWPQHRDDRWIPLHIGRTLLMKDHGAKAPIEGDLEDEGRNRRWVNSSTPPNPNASLPSAPALPSNAGDQRPTKSARLLRKQKV